MKPAGTCAALAAALLSSWPAPAGAQPATPSSTPSARAADAEKPYTFTLKPVVLDSGTAAGTSLGLDYDFTAKYEFAGRQTGAGSDTISLADLDKTFKSGQIDVRARGTLASSKEKNPNKLLDFAAAGVLKIDAPVAYFKLGGVLTFETDQGFDNKQHMFGLSASASKVRILTAGDAGSVLMNFGTVKPTNDAERKRVAGNLDSFKRWDLELSYSIPINKPKVRSVDFDYRHYQETSPPTAIKAEGMDRHRLGLVRLNLDQDFFLQYSRGSLPFDQKSARVVKIGWSLKFE